MSQFQPPQQPWQPEQQPYYPPQQQWQQPQYPPQPETYYPPQPPTKRPAPRAQPPQTSGYGWVWLTIGLFIGLTIGYPVGRGTVITPTTTTTDIQTTTTDQSTPTSQSTTPHTTTYTIGSTASVGPWNVTLNSIKTSHGDAVSSPSAGDIYLVVDVTVNNTSSSPQFVSSGAYFILKDSTGQAYEETITDFGKPPDGTVQAGDKLRGQIVYEVPTNQHTFEYQFQDSTYFGDVATWNLSI